MARSLPGDPLRALEWLVDLGVEREELPNFNPCVPGEFTLPDALYVNTGTPRIVYRGTAEATLPLVTGRWYSMPFDVAERHPSLMRDTRSVSHAPRLAG